MAMVMDCLFIDDNDSEEVNKNMGPHRSTNHYKYYMAKAIQ